MKSFISLLFAGILLSAISGCFIPIGPDTTTTTSTTSTTVSYASGFTTTTINNQTLPQDIYEVDNTKQQAKTLTQNVAQNHSIHVRTDIDFMKLNSITGNTYTFTLSNIDGFYPEVSLYHQNDTVPFLTASPMLDSWNEQITYKSTVTETLYISVKSRYNVSPGTYTINYGFVETPLAVPSGLTASDGTGNTTVALTWSASADATGYDIYRKSAEGSSFIQIGSSAATSYNDTASASNIMKTATAAPYLYTYYVVATNGTKTSAQSNTDTGYLSDYGRITDLAVNIINGNFTLTWTGLGVGTTYDIYYSQGNASNFLPLIGGLTATTYDVKNATVIMQPDITYYFKIIPQKNFVTGEDSNIASNIIPFNNYKPKTPNTLNSLPGYITINWSNAAITSAAGYKLYRCDTSNGTYTVVNSFASSVLTYDDHSVTPGIPYYYKISIYNSINTDSDLSNFASGTADTP